MTKLSPFALVLLALSLAAPAAAQPETRGSLPFMVWDAGMIPADAVNIRTRVYYPTSGGPYPLVGVIHGANANGNYHVELASVLASRGFLCIVPDMPCGVTSCDHDANERQISDLLEWAVAQSGTAGSRIAGLVDGSRRGLIGHSWGGLSSHLTAARNPTIDSLVLLDPNDDGTVGLNASGTITAPVLQLIAEREGACNNAWREAMVRARLSGPNIQVQLNGSGHCDPGEIDLVCSFACGAGNDANTPLFRRYAVAWTACVLAADPAMSTWVGGANFDGAVSSGALENVFEVSLDGLPCNSGVLPDPDAGVVLPGEDAGTVLPGEDAGTVLPGEDAGVVSPGEDAGEVVPGVDAGPTDVPPEAGGCGCRVGGREAPMGVLGVAALALVLRARRR